MRIAISRWSRERGRPMPNAILSPAGSELLHSRGQLLGPGLEGVVDIEPSIERVRHHGGGAASFVDRFPEQAPACRIPPIAFRPRGAGAVAAAIIERERCKAVGSAAVGRGSRNRV